MSAGTPEHMQKRIAILGSTGSIGTQALDVVREQPGHFEVELLSCGNNVDLLIKQALEFKPNAVVIGDAAKLEATKDALFPAGIKVYAGAAALEQCVRMDGIDVVLTALVGTPGFAPRSPRSRRAGHIALANKETLVVAGELITRMAARRTA
jgi:1-deoxy-D-xylulose-5-phosphate reductoisomerase